jgi:hypothetical protein
MTATISSLLNWKTMFDKYGCESNCSALEWQRRIIELTAHDTKRLEIIELIDFESSEKIFGRFDSSLTTSENLFGFGIAISKAR